jgi:hypothetical protein
MTERRTGGRRRCPAASSRFLKDQIPGSYFSVSPSFSLLHSSFLAVALVLTPASGLTQETANLSSPSVGQQPAVRQQPGEPPEQTAGRGRRRVSPPQPQQRQGLDYFVGTWRYSWTGRESPISPGPRIGSVTFSRAGERLEMQAETRLEDGADIAFKESGTLSWDEAGRILSFRESLHGGTQLRGAGDWSSPLSIRYESEPARAGNHTVRVRRTYSILAPHSFSLAEELSIDGGPFVRLGSGVYTKSP